MVRKSFTSKRDFGYSNGVVLGLGLGSGISGGALDAVPVCRDGL